MTIKEALTFTGLAKSTFMARQDIRTGRVFVNSIQVKHPMEQVFPGDTITIRAKVDEVRLPIPTTAENAELTPEAKMPRDTLH